MPLRSRTAFIGAGAGLVLLVLVWFFALHVGFVENADQSVLLGFFDLYHRGLVQRIATHIANLCDPSPWIYFAAVPVLVALARRRPRLAVTIAAILLGANVTTQLLKPLLAQPRADWLFGGFQVVVPASWPSGHATAAMSLALTSVLAAPARLRPAVAGLGAAFAIAVSYSFLTLGWHYPSDVVGGFLVAGTWTLFGVGAMLATDTQRAHGRQVRGRAAEEVRGHISLRDALVPPVGALAAAVALVCLVFVVRPHEVVTYARSHAAFVIGAGAIAVLALALATGLMLAVGSTDRAAPAERR